MRIEKKNLKQLRTSSYNPRIELQPGDDEWGAIESSLEEFGQVLPIVWNERTGNIVGGHQRYNVLRSKGVKEAFVSVVDLPIEREKALNLALNKITGQWDNDKLAEVLSELNQEEIDLTGFNTAEIDILLRSLTEAEIDFPETDVSIEESHIGIDEEPDETKTEVFPSEEKNDERGTGGRVEVRIGEFAFTIPREVYEAWAREIRSMSDRQEEMNEEIMIRLGI